MSHYLSATTVLRDDDPAPEVHHWVHANGVEHISVNFGNMTVTGPKATMQREFARISKALAAAHYGEMAEAI